MVEKEEEVSRDTLWPKKSRVCRVLRKGFERQRRGPGGRHEEEGLGSEASSPVSSCAASSSDAFFGAVFSMKKQKQRGQGSFVAGFFCCTK